MIPIRYKLTLEYIGAGYCGWQRQPDHLSLQQIIEDAIFNFSKERVVLSVVGRTDAGVNAYGQIVHFDLEKQYDPRRLMHSINHFSRPHTIGVVDAEIVNLNFHARFSAKGRHYVYKILNRDSVNIINRGLQHWVRYNLDVKEMQKATSYLLGRHDFSSFRSSICQSKSPIKTIDKIEIIKYGDSIDIHISALSFLHHMVRNIVGSLLMVGKGSWKAEKIKTILSARDRKVAGPIALSEALYFLKVDY